jgi:hypothetical protein
MRLRNGGPVDKALRGRRRPRLQSVPSAKTDAGAECVALAATFGLVLDPWEADTLRAALGERRSDGRWTSFEVGVCAPRQNGKGSIKEARTLGGLFLFDEQLIIDSSHEWRTAKESMRRLEALLARSPHAWKPNRTHGEESIELPPHRELKRARRVMFQTRTMAGGRGLTGDTVFLDEAMILQTAAVQALMPTLAARPNPQVWYLGSAVDQKVHPHGEVFTAVRRRALRGDSPRLCYREWSVDEDTLDLDTPKGFRAAITAANPGIGYRISEEYVRDEFEAFKDLNPRGWMAERLGIGDWPALGAAKSVFDMDRWAACCNPGAKAVIPAAVALVVAVAPDRDWSSIGIAGAHGAATLIGCWSLPGTARVADTLTQLLATRTVTGPVMLAGEQAKALRPDLVRAGIDHKTLNRNDMGAACAAFQIAAGRAAIIHVGQPELDLAVRNARTRMVGESEQWDRRDPTVDDSPLVAVSGAYYQWGLAHPAAYNILASVR